MGYLGATASLRLDPSLLLPGVRSVIVGAVRYGPQAPPPASALAGEVSCYAWGEDYHAHVGRRAEELAAFLRDRYGVSAISFCDTGPVLERLWAARAGVGWIGRNALVIDRDLGSFLFLAAVLTDLEVPADEPAVDHCGTCRLCLDACPTGAIVEDRVVDSRLCLAYLTIERRGPLPAELRPETGSRIFGCDDCQTVCPWNRGEPSAGGPFAEIRGNARPDPTEILRMDLAAYTERFRGTAMKRATFHGLRRNAALALGNLLADNERGAAGRPPLSREERDRAIGALRSAACDPEETVADAARWALGRAGPTPA